MKKEKGLLLYAENKSKELLIGDLNPAISVGIKSLKVTSECLQQGNKAGEKGKHCQLH